MMDVSMWGIGWMGGDGGIWVPILVGVMVVAFVVWYVKRKNK